GSPFAALAIAPGRFPALRQGMAIAAWPRVDVFERDGHVVVKAELPGVEQKDIDLSIEDGDLVLRAEQHAEKEVREDHFYRMERQSGAIYRRLPLPEGISAEKVNATLKDGILEITAPKPAERAGKTHKIVIH
ncbi:MAG: Hsp20/alpha crystallin family protein, partial [Thermomicrobiales bacterium]